jgi:hypothetical protein
MVSSEGLAIALNKDPIQDWMEAWMRHSEDGYQMVLLALWEMHSDFSYLSRDQVKSLEANVLGFAKSIQEKGL